MKDNKKINNFIPPYQNELKHLKLLRDEFIAVQEENYELAANVRDEIIKLNKQQKNE
jgi:protein-arginine kinase activator protein McsA